MLTRYSFSYSYRYNVIFTSWWSMKKRPKTRSHQNHRGRRKEPTTFSCSHTKELLQQNFLISLFDRFLSLFFCWTVDIIILGKFNCCHNYSFHLQKEKDQKKRLLSDLKVSSNGFIVGNRTNADVAENETLEFHSNGLFKKFSVVGSWWK